MLTTEQKFKALTWKCDQLGISYGKLRSISSEKDIQKICQEYEKELAERKKRKRAEAAAAQEVPVVKYKPPFQFRKDGKNKPAKTSD